MLELSIYFPHLGIYLEQVERSIHVYGVEIPFYGIFIAIGLLIGMWFAVIEAKRTQQNPNFYLDTLILSTGAALLGSRLYYVLFSWGYYREHSSEILDIRQGGLAIYGGILCGALASLLFARIKKKSFWQIGDTVCIGLLTGQIIGRWGDFFNREAFGEYTDSLFAMQLPVSSVHPFAITAQMREHLVQIQNIDFIQVHPIFLYEILWNVALLLLLMQYRRKKKFSGELFLMYLAGYALGRSWMEGLRTDQLLIPWLHLPVSQILSVLLAISCTVTIFVKREMTRRRKAAQKSWQETEIQEIATESDILSAEELEVLQRELEQENSVSAIEKPQKGDAQIQEEAPKHLSEEPTMEPAKELTDEAKSSIDSAAKNEITSQNFIEENTLASAKEATTPQDATPVQQDKPEIVDESTDTASEQETKSDTTKETAEEAPQEITEIDDAKSIEETLPTDPKALQMDKSTTDYADNSATVS